MNEIIEFPPLSDNPQLDDALIDRLQYDLATKMHNPTDIARRYGLMSREGLREYLRRHPQIVYEAKRLREVYLSDECSEPRVRMKFLHATEHLIIPMTHLASDPRTPISARVDAFKQLQRGAGVDGAPAAAKGAEKQLGHAFNLTINFAGGRKTQINGTTVIDADEIPGPSTPALGSITNEEESELDEEI